MIDKNRNGKSLPHGFRETSRKRSATRKLRTAEEPKLIPLHPEEKFRQHWKAAAKKIRRAPNPVVRGAMINEAKQERYRMRAENIDAKYSA